MDARDGEGAPAIGVPDYGCSLDESIFSSQFVVTEVPQITNVGFWRRSRGRETSGRGADSRDAHLRAIRDVHGRIMVAMTHNLDIADSWEREGEDPGFFFEQFSPTATRSASMSCSTPGPIDGIRFARHRRPHASRHLH